ncbi:MULTISPECIES: porin [unclassified Janthinobacterium]|uniref:porin n=1 Tax=unclassified Janthinobacterium TaxID=2610881 RepID=UPI00034BA365|nr:MULTISPECIES: porin [unclassified Janthinobacterium]MEC5159373.1 putative porin [Janthinobacterium sp. CG_S6]
MKKTLLALAVLSIPAFAAAQSNVTIYGIADISVNHFSGHNGGLQNNGSSTRIDSSAGNNLAGSRLGFKGKEDLGNGLSADFKLEMGMLLDTGKSEQGGRLFGRAARVGLNGGFGSVHLGRQDTPGFELLGTVDPMGVGLAGSSANIHAGNKGIFPIGRLGGAVQQGWMSLAAFRADNSVRYDTPTIQGFSGSLLYGAGEKASASEGRLGIAAANYNQGPLFVGYVHIDDNSANAFVPKSKQKSDALGATYDFGAVKVHGLVAAKKAVSSGVVDKADYFLLGLSAPVGQSGQVLASFNRSKGKNSTVNSADQFGVGYLYSMSKRTTFYTSAAKIKNKGKAAFGIDGYDNHDGAAFDYSTLFNVGITHAF